MGTKHIGVMSVAFQGHVKSSVRWPLDSQVAISYLHQVIKALILSSNANSMTFVCNVKFPNIRAVCDTLTTTGGLS